MNEADDSSGALIQTTLKCTWVSSVGELQVASQVASNRVSLACKIFAGRLKGSEGSKILGTKVPNYFRTRHRFLAFIVPANGESGGGGLPLTYP